MKLSNATIYRSMFNVAAEPTAIEEAMRANEFVPCSAGAERSVGWVPPRDSHGALLEVVAGQWVARLMIETKSVPAAILRRKLDERCAEIEKTTGRKPGRKERKDLKSDLILESLPMAFEKRSAVDVWIDPVRNVIVLNTPSQSRADDVATQLVRVVDGLALSLFSTAMQPGIAMSLWLSDGEAPAGFTVDRDAELVASDESKAKVRYTNHPLDTDEVRQHIADGMRPTKLALTWEDRVSFVLTEGLTLRSLSFLEGTMAGGAQDVEADNFDADVTISTGETANLIAALVEALGGVQQMTISEAQDEAAGTLRSAVQGLEDLARQDGGKIAIEFGGKTLVTFGDGPDPLLAKARAIVIEHGKPSISLVQRHLRIGYNRAARLLEELEKEGVVSPAGAVGRRTIATPAQGAAS